MTDARMEHAQRTCQSRRGHDFRPYTETPFEQFGRVIFKSLPALIVLGACVYLLWVF